MSLGWGCASERIGLCIRMRRFPVRFIRPESFVHTRSSAGFTITTSGFKFSVHTPTEADIRMMAFGFREFTNLLNKGKRLAEIAKPEAPLDAVSFLRQLPVWGLCVKELSLLAREWRYTPRDGEYRLCQQELRAYYLPLVSTCA